MIKKQYSTTFKLFGIQIHLDFDTDDGPETRAHALRLMKIFPTTPDAQHLFNLFSRNEIDVFTLSEKVQDSFTRISQAFQMRC